MIFYWWNWSLICFGNLNLHMICWWLGTDDQGITPSVFHNRYSCHLDQDILTLIWAPIQFSQGHLEEMNRQTTTQILCFQAVGFFVLILLVLSCCWVGMHSSWVRASSIFIFPGVRKYWNKTWALVNNKDCLVKYGDSHHEDNWKKKTVKKR